MLKNLFKGATIVWPMPSLTTMSSALLHFFCAACGWQWIVVTKGDTPSVVIGSKCFPGLWWDVEARHATLDDVLIVQLGSSSCARRIIEFAVKDILGQAAIPHTMDVAQPAHTSLRNDGMRSYETVTCRMVALRMWSLHETPRMERWHLN